MFLRENKVTCVPDVKRQNMDYEKIIHDLDLQSENFDCETVSLKGNRKRMKLHQLSWEEKLQRKKLRNRIAAQVSRDRKKAKMDHLEEEVRDLRKQNDLLFMEVEELKKKNELLVDVNQELRKAISVRPYTCSCLRSSEEEKKTEDDLNEIQSSMSVNDDHSFLRPAESFEIPQQKGECATFDTSCDDDILMEVLENTSSLPFIPEMLGDLKEDKVINELERLATSLLEEVEQYECRRNSQNTFNEISSSDQAKWACNNKVVGEAPEILESHCSRVNFKENDLQQQYLKFDSLTVTEKIFIITSEHSYALPSPHESHQMNLEKKRTTVLPSIEVSEPIVALTDADPQNISETDIKESSVNLDIPFFPNFCSPKSEVSSDLGYESIASPYGSDLSSSDSWSDLWGDTLPELFPELI